MVAWRDFGSLQGMSTRPRAKMPRQNAVAKTTTTPHHKSQLLVELVNFTAHFGFFPLARILNR